jgi:hypothetical protein
MLKPARALAFTGMLLLGVGRPSAAALRPDTSSLQFLGFRAGARLDEIDTRLRSLGGDPLRCRRSRVDHRVMECRATLNEPELGWVVSLWISAIDSAAGVMTLSGSVDPDQLERWRQALRSQYGAVDPRTQGSQSMLQWVRRGRMMRLTWRLEGSGKIASVSLVDGHVLDAWGRSRRGSSQTAPGRAGSIRSAAPGSCPGSPPACSRALRSPSPSASAGEREPGS